LRYWLGPLLMLGLELGSNVLLGKLFVTRLRVDSRASHTGSQAVFPAFIRAADAIHPKAFRMDSDLSRWMRIGSLYRGEKARFPIPGRTS